MHTATCNKWLHNRRKVNNCENTVANGIVLLLIVDINICIYTKTADLLIIGIN